MTLTRLRLRVAAKRSARRFFGGGSTLVGRLGWGSFVAFVIYAGGFGTSYLAQLAVARAVGAYGYGNYAFVVAWASPLAYLAALGFDVSLLRFVSGYRAQQRWGLARGVIRYADRRVIGMGLSIVAVGLLGLSVFGQDIRPELRATFTIGLPLVPLWALIWLRCSAVRALGGVVTALAPDRLVRDGLLVLLIGFVALAGWRIDAPMAMAATVLSALVAFVVTSLALRRQRPAALVRARVEYEAARWRQTVLPLVVLAVTETLMNRIGVVALGWYGMIRDAGIYSLAFNMSMLVLLPRIAVNALLAPVVAELFARNDRAGLNALISRTGWWNLLGAGGVALAIALLAQPILRFLGPDFLEGGSILRILLLGQVVASAAGAQLFLLTMTGHERSAATLHTVAVLVNIVIAVVFIRASGLSGAAWAAMLAQLVLTGSLAVLLWRKLRLAPAALALFELLGRYVTARAPPTAPQRSMDAR
jgi:O-antigen/teichoic acid export membrane protein